MQQNRIVGGLFTALSCALLISQTAEARTIKGTTRSLYRNLAASAIATDGSATTVPVTIVKQLDTEAGTVYLGKYSLDVAEGQKVTLVLQQRRAGGILKPITVARFATHASGLDWTTQLNVTAPVPGGTPEVKLGQVKVKRKLSATTRNPLGDVDSDGDGTPDVEDTDDDNDGILDTNDTDVDGDEVEDNEQDLDGEDDGIPDVVDTDDDNDGIPDVVDTDDDNDGVEDSDGDTDSDDDGIDDADDPDKDNDGIEDADDDDMDGDGILDDDEADADHDGIPDDCDDDDDNDGVDDDSDDDNDDDGIADEDEDEDN